MLETKAVFFRKEADFEPKSCVVEKVIRLSGAEYDSFRRNMLRDQDFIRDNPIDTVVDKNGRYHCLLVVGEGRRDGILVNSEGADYARYSAFIPNAEDFLTMNRYPALAALSEKLTAVVDILATQAGAGSSERYGTANLKRWSWTSGLDLTPNGTLLNTIVDMLRERPEVSKVELGENELIIYREADGAELAAPAVSEPSDSRNEFALWQARTESSRFKWREDEIFRLNGRGAFYYTGGENGIYIKIHKDGLLEAGTYEGAIPHIGEAFFTVEAKRQCKDYSEAFTVAMEAGGKQFLADMFSQDSPPAPVVPVAGKPSVADQIKAARQAPRNIQERDSQKHKKDKGGPEL